MAPNLPSNGFDLLAFAASDIQVEHNMKSQKVLTVEEKTKDLAVDDYWVWETNRDDHTTYLSTASRIQLEHDNYWDWSASNPHKDILTLQYLESKLTEFVKPDIVVHGHNPADTENYWETTSAKDKESQAIHSHGSSLMNYWNWPESGESKRDLMIAYILQEEEIRQMFISGVIERQLKSCASDLYWADIV